MNVTVTRPRVTSLAPQFPRQRSGAVDRLLSQDWVRVRRSLGRILRHRTDQRAGVAPERSAPRTRRSAGIAGDNQHLDAAAGVDGIAAFYERCVSNGVTILKPLAPTDWGHSGTSTSKIPTATSSASADRRHHENHGQPDRIQRGRGAAGIVPARSELPDHP